MTKKIKCFSLSLFLSLSLLSSVLSFDIQASAAEEKISSTESKAAKASPKKIGPKAVLYALLLQTGFPSKPGDLIAHLWKKHSKRASFRKGIQEPKRTDPTRTLLKEVFHGVFGGALFAATKRKLTGPCKNDPAVKKGLVLIHGTGTDGASQWPAVESWLKEAGIINVLTVNYNSHQKIKLSCADIWKQVRERFSPEDELLVIGHSQGGLIARALVDHKECRESENKQNPKITSVFCLNAPLKGSLMVDLLDPHKKEGQEFHDSYYDMSTESSFIEELKEGITENQFSVKSGIRILEVVSENDTFVHPSYSYSYGTENVISLGIPGAGHFTAAIHGSFWRYTLIPEIKKHYDH